MTEENTKKVIGRVEYVSFPDFELADLVAKVDTGAYNGSIHVSNVEECEHNGKSAIKFRLIDPTHPQYQDKDFYSHNFFKKKVRSSNGEVNERYFIPLQISLGFDTFTADFSLAERHGMRKPVLLGRKTIKHRYIVDVSKEYCLQAEK
jgi:hypothetical protein